MTDAKRLAHLDGLRGIAAVIVFVAHLTIVIFPSIFNGLPIMSRLRYEWILAGTPVGILWAANFAVCIFFVMSALVLSHFYEREGSNFIAACIRRYIRLALPILATSLIAYLLWRYGAMYNLKAQIITQEGWLKVQYLTPAPGFRTYVWESFVGAFQTGQSAINPVLWTMKYEIEGSLGVFLLYALVPQRRLRLIVLVILAVASFQTYYVCFVGGVLIYEWSKHDPDAAVIPPQLSAMAIVAGAYMGAFPYNVGTPDNVWFGPMAGVLTVEEWHQIGAIPLVFGCMTLRSAVNWLSRPTFRYLGKISFSLYLIHGPLICSFTSFLIVAIYWLHPNARLAMFAAAAATIPVTFAIAHILTEWVDKPSTKLSAIVGRKISIACDDNVTLRTISTVQDEHQATPIVSARP